MIRTLRTRYRHSIWIRQAKHAAEPIDRTGVPVKQGNTCRQDMADDLAKKQKMGTPEYDRSDVLQMEPPELLAQITFDGRSIKQTFFGKLDQFRKRQGSS